MVEERTYDELLSELSELSGQNQDIDYSDEVAYYRKCKMLDRLMQTGKQTGLIYDMSRVYLNDFFGEVFERPMNGDPFWQPFQFKEAPHYTKWREEEDSGIHEHDYKSYEEPKFVYNPLLFYKTKREDKRSGERMNDGTNRGDRNRYKVLTKDDWEAWEWLETRYFCLTAPMTFTGKVNSAKNARFLYALTVDLDDVGERELANLIQLFIKPHTFKDFVGLSVIPVPNLIVNSGHGMHLYYILERPLAMYPRNARITKQLIAGIYNLVCKPGVTTKVKNPHCLGIYHMFRLPDTLTKPLRKYKNKNESVGIGVPIRAWKFDIDRYTVSDLMRYFVHSELSKIITPPVIKQLEEGSRILNPNRLTREQALQKYGHLAEKGEIKGNFFFNRAVYDKWLERFQDPVKTGVQQGHRYYCIMMLAALARKCNVPFAELQRDATALIGVMDSLTVKADNHFDKNDVTEALKAYNNPDCVRWTKFMMQNWTGIKMPLGIKRNKRKQNVHLSRIRAAQAAEDTEGAWRQNNGRKVETTSTSRIALMIRQWMLEHPRNTNKSQCARDLTAILQTERQQYIERRSSKGRDLRKSEKMMTVSRTTVTKWWNMIVEEDPDIAFDQMVGAMTKNMVEITPEYQFTMDSDNFQKWLLGEESETVDGKPIQPRNISEE